MRIGCDHVLSFNPDFNWIYASNQEIQIDYFREFAALPGAEKGKIDLFFADKDKNSDCDW